MMIGDYYGALNDARKTVLLDPLFVKVIIHVIMYYSIVLMRLLIVNLMLTK